MQKFKYKFTSLIIVLICLLIVLALACMGFNIYRLITALLGNFEITLMNWISYGLLVILPIVAIVLSISALVSSFYEITNTQVILKWGLMKNTIELKDIKSVKLRGNERKLELIFYDDAYFIVQTNEEWFESFVDVLKEKRPQITFIQDTVETKK